MDFLNWYDFIQPTNPYAAILFGVIFSIIVAVVVWLDSKELRTTGVALVTGLSVTIIGVLLLNFVGFYG